MSEQGESEVASEVRKSVGSSDASSSKAAGSSGSLQPPAESKSQAPTKEDGPQAENESQRQDEHEPVEASSAGSDSDDAEEEEEDDVPEEYDASEEGDEDEEDEDGEDANAIHEGYADDDPEAPEEYDTDESSSSSSSSVETQSSESESEDSSSTSSDNADTVTTVSNEVSVADSFEIHDVERQPALIFPEPPWKGKASQVSKVAIVLFMPVVLIVVVLFGIYKFIEVFFQCLLDAADIGAKLIWLLIRLALSPLLILYHLLIPSYIKKHVDVLFDKHIGRRIRFILRVKRFVVYSIRDIPFIILSCALAFIETCILPARDGGRSCCWHYVGRHIFKHIMFPLYLWLINRTSHSRRKHVDASRKDHDLRALAIRNQKKAHKKKRDRRERAKKARQAKCSEVKLNVPQAEIADQAHKQFTIEEKPATERFTRTMIVERRYAVAVGVFWSLVGVVTIIVTLDGQPGERCEICVQNESVGVVVCRHGIGRDCAFRLHQSWLLIGTGVLTMGMIVMIYSTFLYRPHEGALDAIAMEKIIRMRQSEAKRSHTHKIVDPDTAAIQMVCERNYQPSVPRMLLRIYRGTPCNSIQRLCSHFSNKPLKAFYRYERRKAWAKRSIKFSERFIGWVEKCVINEEILAAREADKAEKLQESIEKHGLRKVAKMSGFEGMSVPSLKKGAARSRLSLARSGLSKHTGPMQRIAYIVCFPLLFILKSLVTCLGKSPCVPCLSRLIDRFPRLKQCLQRIFGKKKDPFKKDTDGWSGAPSTMEDVLARFGFDIATEDDEDKEKEEKPETPFEKQQRLLAERPDALGHLETLREVGMSTGKDEIPDDDDLEPTIAELAGSAHEAIDLTSDAGDHSNHDEGEEEEHGEADHEVGELAADAGGRNSVSFEG